MNSADADPGSRGGGLLSLGVVLLIACALVAAVPAMGAADATDSGQSAQLADAPNPVIDQVEPVEMNEPATLASSHDDDETEFVATNTGGSIVVGAGEGSEGTEIDFPEGGVTIEGVIDEESNTWESTSVEFPGLETSMFEVNATIPNGFTGEFDRENEVVTASGELVISLEMGGESSIQLDATTASSGDMTGSASFDGDTGSVRLVDNQYTVPETGNALVDGGVGLPAKEPGENRLELPLDLEFEESGDDGESLPFNVSINEEASTLDVRDGEEVELVASMSNPLSDRATQRIDLLLDGETQASTTVSLEAGATTRVDLSSQVTLDDDGATVQFLGHDETRTISVLPAPEVSVTPKKVHFADVEAGETVSETITVANQGDAPLEVTRAELAANSGDFSLSGGGSFTIDQADSEQLEVVFAPTEGGAQSTYLYINTNDPTAGNHVIALTSGNVDMEVSVDEDGSTRMEATVDNATAGEPTNVNLPEQSQSEEFETDNVTLTPAIDGNIDINLTTSDESLESTPERRDGLEVNTSMVGNISAESNLANDQIDEAGFTVTVDKDKLERWDTDPGNVSFYRFDEDTEEWVQRGGEVVSETADTATVRILDDHFSEWTAAAARPEFDITNTQVNVQKATINEEVGIQVFVENIGGTEGTYVADLLLDGEVIDSQDAIIAEGGEELFQFQRQFAEAGTYEIQVNEVKVDDIEITEAETTDGNETDGEEEDEEEDADSGGPGFGVIVALVAALLGLTLAMRRSSS